MQQTRRRHGGGYSRKSANGTPVFCSDELNTDGPPALTTSPPFQKLFDDDDPLRGHPSVAAERVQQFNLIEREYAWGFLIERATIARIPSTNQAPKRRLAPMFAFEAGGV